MSNGTENTATGTGTISAETPSTDTPSTGTLFEIKHRYTDAVLYSGKHATLKGAVEAAIAARANLDGAYLAGAYLAGAYLDGAYLARANLARANLDGANLARANLARANLDGANLDGAYLARANLAGATTNWKSHWLISELLWRKADSPSQEQLAAWVGRKTDWCWNEWIKLNHPDRAWALETLKKHVRDGDNAPDILRSPSSVTP